MVNIIGIDCAADFNKIGITFSKLNDNKWIVQDIEAKLDIEYLERFIGNSIKRNEKLIIGLDTPLGWSIGLIKFLNNHYAGKFIDSDKENYKDYSELLFKRETDRLIKKKLKINPLEIGADKIARMSIKTFEILDHIGKRVDKKPKLIWSPVECDSLSIIEVYPKATLIGFGFYDKFKKKDYSKIAFQKAVAEIIIPEYQKNKQSLLDKIFNEGVNRSDNYDSLICGFTVKEFMRGNLSSPEEILAEKKDEIEKEGWIWTKFPE